MRQYRLAQLPITLCAALMACTGAPAESTEASTTTADERLIRFPDAAYQSATPISFGQTLNLPFSASAGYVAVKFNAQAGEVVRFTASGPNGATSYLVYNRSNVAALRNAGDAAGAFRYTIAQSGEYFIMLRSQNRANATLQIQLERMGATTSATYSAAELLGAAPASAEPKQVGPGGYITINTVSLRQCVPATGCGATQRTATIYGNELDYNGFGSSSLYSLRYAENRALVSLRFDVAPSAIVGLAQFYGTVARNESGRELTSSGGASGDYSVNTVHRFDGTQSTVEGDVRLTVGDRAYNNGAPTPRTFRYSLQYTRTSLHLSLRSEVSRNGLQWSEYAADFDAPLQALPSYSRFAKVNAPTRGDFPANISRNEIDDDEQVISRFVPGELEMPVYASAAGAAARLFTAATSGSQCCAPRTGCAEAQRNTAPNVAERIVGTLGRAPGDGDNIKIAMRITGPDSYAVVLVFMSRPGVVIPIVDGKGTFVGASGSPTYTVKVTRDGLLFEAPYERSSTPRTAKFTKLDGSTEDETGYVCEQYNDPTFLVRFNTNWVW